MNSLQNTIFVFFVVLLLAIQAVLLNTNLKATQEREKAHIEYQLTIARKVFETEFQNRKKKLSALADTVARDFALKQVFQDDVRSLATALDNHRDRIGANIFMVINDTGEVRIQITTYFNEQGQPVYKRGADEGQPFAHMDWLTDHKNSREDTLWYQVGLTYYQLYFAPVSSGEKLIGWLAFGFAIDDQLADELYALIGMDNGFLVHSGDRAHLLAMSHHSDRATESEMQSLSEQILDNTLPEQLIGSGFTLADLAEDKRLMAIVYGRRSDLVAELQKNWQQLGLLAAFILLASLIGAYWIARRVSRPVAELERQARTIAAGNYDYQVSVKARGELADLIDEFKHMQQEILSRENKISHQAFHDELTNLPNQNRLMLVLRSLCENPDLIACVTKFAIRRVDEINANLGFAVGDELIQIVGKRLTTLIDADDRLFHLGGSEFVFIDICEFQKDVSHRLEEVVDKFENIISIENISLFIEIHMGSALFPVHDADPEGLLQKASIALQNAEFSGIPYQIYHCDLGSQSAERHELINDLNTAIRENEMVLYYQPKLELKTNRVGRAEALIRWQHPDKGMIPPDKFITLAEQTGLINEMTLWVLETAAKQHLQWRRTGHQIAIAVNISAENFKQPQFYEQVMSVYEQYALPVSAISLEMTESVVAEEPENVIRILNQFKSAGIELSVDDYGTGYSSLAQLKHLPVSELKIDKSFIQNVLKDKSDQTIVQSTIDMAHRLGMHVVAEGVEDQETLTWLDEHGCDFIQGYYIFHPVMEEEFIDWLAGSNYS